MLVLRNDKIMEKGAVYHEKKQVPVEQVAFALRQAESGTPIPDVCRKMGISEQTFYRWKKKYDGMCGLR